MKILEKMFPKGGGEPINKVDFPPFFRENSYPVYTSLDSDEVIID